MVDRRFGRRGVTVDEVVGGHVHDCQKGAVLGDLDAVEVAMKLGEVDLGIGDLRSRCRLIVGALCHRGSSSRALVELGLLRIDAIAPGGGVAGHDLLGLECLLIDLTGECGELAVWCLALGLLLNFLYDSGISWECCNGWKEGCRQYAEGHCETWMVCSRIPAQIRKSIVSRHPGVVHLSFTNVFQ
jgi:hypothetical protein